MVISTYGSLSSLFYGNRLKESREGVQQGDPLGPALFCLIIHSVIANLQSELCIFYLDDITIGGYWQNIVHDFWRLGLLAKDVGLSLNLNKCEVMCRDHTTLGSLLVNIPGLMVVNPESPTFLGSSISVAEGIDSILGKKIDSLTAYFRRET